MDEDERERVKYWLLDACDRFYSPHEGLHRALVEAGYTRIRIERLATHPVWQVRATLPPDASVADRRLLKSRFRALLKSAHLPAKSDELFLMPTGRILLASFVQELGRPVLMRDGVATLIEDNDPDLFLEYDE